MRRRRPAGADWLEEHGCVGLYMCTQHFTKEVKWVERKIPMVCNIFWDHRRHDLREAIQKQQWTGAEVSVCAGEEGNGAVHGPGIKHCYPVLREKRFSNHCIKIYLFLSWSLLSLLKVVFV